MSSWTALPIVAGLVFAVLALDAAARETPTIDEFAHVPAGFAHVVSGRFDVHAKNPPLGKILLALPGVVAQHVQVPVPRENPFAWGPWHYGKRFMYANAAHYFAIFLGARAVVVLFALLTATLVFVWARALFGARAAAITTSLFLLCPTLLGHGHLATLDVFCSFTILGSAFAVRGALQDPRPARWLLAGALWGVALLVKFTAVLLLPAFVVLAVWAHWPRWRHALAALAALIVPALGVLHVGMPGARSLEPLGAYHFGSSLAQSLQQRLPDALPVPLPTDYLRGFDAVLRDVESGEFPSYLSGQWSTQGWWYYEAIALLVKMPEPFLVMGVLCPFLLRRQQIPRRELLALCAPLGSVAFMMTAFNHLNVGLRYLLPVLPFVYVLLGAVWTRWGRGARIAAALALAYTAASSLSVHPSELAYFNLLSGGPANGHRWLLDSNLDWGQDLYRLRPALEERGLEGPISLLYFGHVDPALYGIEYELLPSQPKPGILAVSVTYLAGFQYPALAPNGHNVVIRKDYAAWLRGREPIARLGSLWLFDTRSEEADAPR